MACLLCNLSFCRQCYDDEKHYKKHNDNRLYFIFESAYLYSETIFNSESECIYRNAFQQTYETRKKEAFALDVQRLQKVFNKFMST